jgi:uncharacterized membrane protein
MPDRYAQPALIVRSPKEIAGPATTTVEAVLAKAALFGLGGWAGENILYGPRYSPVFQGHKVPFLPVYAAGGLAVIATAPHIAGKNVVFRALVYAALGTAIEYAGCQLDRKVFDGRSWDYGEIDGLAESTDGCISWRHSALWGGLGLLAEKLS